MRSACFLLLSLLFLCLPVYAQEDQEAEAACTAQELQLTVSEMQSGTTSSVSSPTQAKHSEENESAPATSVSRTESLKSRSRISLRVTTKLLVAGPS